MIKKSNKLKNTKFIHIGKCAGTSIKEKLNIPEYHLNRNYKKDENYIIWIRNPINRFVAAFNYVHAVINTDISQFRNKPITIHNCLAPAKIRNKIRSGHALPKRYEYLINYFDTANELAESITSENETKRKLALELMNDSTEHIFKGTGWYLYNGDFVEKNHDKIAFVGSCENMVIDTQRLSESFDLSYDMKPNEKMRENKINNKKFLSSKAIRNIIDFYKGSDYKALQKLLEYNFIEKSLLEQYYQYNL